MMICSVATKVTKISCCKRKFSHISDDSFDVALLEKEDKQLRTTMLKKRFASMIFKSEQQLLLGKDYDEEQMKKKKEQWENQNRQRERKEARIAMDSIKRTVDFGDNLIAEREIMMMIGKNQFDEQQKRELWDEIEKAKLMLERQKEREAARIALQNMKRTVYIGDDMQAEKEFLMLIGAVKNVKC